MGNLLQTILWETQCSLLHWIIYQKDPVSVIAENWLLLLKSTENFPSRFNFGYTKRCCGIWGKSCETSRSDFLLTLWELQYLVKEISANRVVHAKLKRVWFEVICVDRSASPHGWTLQSLCWCLVSAHCSAKECRLQLVRLFSTAQ